MKLPCVLPCHPHSVRLPPGPAYTDILESAKSRFSACKDRPHSSPHNEDTCPLDPYREGLCFVNNCIQKSPLPYWSLSPESSGVRGGSQEAPCPSQGGSAPGAAAFLSVRPFPAPGQGPQGESETAQPWPPLILRRAAPPPPRTSLLGLAKAPGH